MLSLNFPLTEGENLKRTVLRMKYKTYDKMTIQIAEVVEYYEKGHRPVTEFVYEEIDNETDFITYSDYISEEEVRKLHPWFYET